MSINWVALLAAVAVLLLSLCSTQTSMTKKFRILSLTPTVSDVYSNPVAPAPLIAINEINSRHWFDDYNFTFDFQWQELPSCDERITVEALVNYSSANGGQNADLMLVGIDCDDVCRQVSTLSQVWENVLGSYACRLVDLSSNINAINTLTLRMDMSSLVTSFVRYCKWKSVAIVSSLDSNALSTASRYLTSLNYVNITAEYLALDVLTASNGSAIPEAMNNLRTITIATIKQRYRSKAELNCQSRSTK